MTGFDSGVSSVDYWCRGPVPMRFQSLVRSAPSLHLKSVSVIVSTAKMNGLWGDFMLNQLRLIDWLLYLHEMMRGITSVVKQTVICYRWFRRRAHFSVFACACVCLFVRVCSCMCPFCLTQHRYLVNFGGVCASVCVSVHFTLSC